MARTNEKKSTRQRSRRKDAISFEKTKRYYAKTKTRTGKYKSNETSA